MNISQNTEGMNLYEGYLSLVKKQRGPGITRRTAALIPLGVLLAALLIAGGVIAIRNAGIRTSVNAAGKRITGLQSDYDQALALQQTCDEREAEYSSLVMSRALFTLYPPLTRTLFEQVRECAADLFTITQYGYSEGDGTLVIYANAESVNEVPKFVERLRDTGLFRSVQYTGYTSDSNARYYCTVGCTLAALPETME